MKYLTLKEIQSKYGYKYFDLYKVGRWVEPNINGDTLYEVRGVSNESRENYNTIADYLSWDK
jgi:hypothetical protein